MDFVNKFIAYFKNVKLNYEVILQYALIVLSVSYACYRGFRMPGGWSENYYQISMFDGFFRRSFIGTLLSPLGCQRFNYFVIAFFQISVLFCVLSSLVIFALRQKLWLYLIVYLFSDAGGFLFHEVGYVEQFIYLLLIVEIYFISEKKYLISAVVASASLLSSELAIMTSIPLMIVACVCAEHRINIRSLILLLAPPIVIFVLQYAFFQTVSASTIERFVALRSQCGFPMIRGDYLDVFSTRYNTLSSISFTPWQIVFDVIPLMVLGIVTTISIRMEKFAAFAVAYACIVPLAVGMLGWDSNRWLFLCYTNIFISLIIVRIFDNDSANLNKSKISVCLVMFFVVSLFLSIGYFDGFSPRKLNHTGFVGFICYISKSINVVPKF